jgi:hypothetical protein
MSIESPKRGPKLRENRSWIPQLTATLNKFSPEMQQVFPWNHQLPGIIDKKPQGPQTKVMYMELMEQEKNGAVELVTTENIAKGLYGIMEIKVLDPMKFTGGYIKLPISKWCSNSADFKKNARIWEVAQFFRTNNGNVHYHYMHYDALAAIGIHRKKPTIRSRRIPKLPPITSLLFTSQRLESAASTVSIMTQSLQNVASTMLLASELLENDTLKTTPKFYEEVLMTDSKMAIQSILAKD